MTLGDLIKALFADPITNAALQGVLLVALLELATGILRAFASKQFDFALVDVWVRTQLAGRVLPILLVLIASRVGGGIKVGDTDLNLLWAAGIAAAAVYAASAVKSIMDNLTQKTDTKPTE
jgi:hypothetical protein